MSGSTIGGLVLVIIGGAFFCYGFYKLIKHGNVKPDTKAETKTDETKKA